MEQISAFEFIGDGVGRMDKLFSVLLGQRGLRVPRGHVASMCS